VVLCYAAYHLAASRLIPSAHWLIAAFPPVLANAIIGQAGLLTAAIFAAALLSIERRPLLAGLLLGCLIIKPQLGIMIPIALLAGRQWRTLAGACLSSAGLLLLSLLLFGIQPFVAMMSIMPLFGSIANEGLTGWHKMASLYAALSLIGVAAQIAWAAHIAAAFLAAVLLYRCWRANCHWQAKGASLAAATTLASPYLYIYDLVILIVPFLWLARNQTLRPWLALLWLIPLVSLVQIMMGDHSVNLLPIVPLVLLWLLWREIFPAHTPSSPSSLPSRSSAARSSDPPICEPSMKI
jgi:alpha-1,2-mannosyltransferase